MERISRFRAIILLIIFILILILFAGRLFVLQIIETDGNTDNTATYSTITTIRAARGDILDRNGNVLVGNRASYDLVFNHYVIESSDGTNESLYRLVQKCAELGVTYLDHFPVTKTRPFEYTLTEFNTAWQNHFQKFMIDRDLDSDITAPLLIEKLRKRYDIPAEWDDEMARAVIAMRYEFDLRGITNLPTYTFIEDVSDANLSAILELNTPGLMVESSTVREYYTQYAAHILGYVGGMDAAEWEIYKTQDYSMDAYIGQSGFEEAFEEYLHGIDGQRLDVVSKDGAIIKQEYTKNPRAGANVETTIDINLQMIAEDALAQVMSDITNPEVNTAIGDKEGHDAEGAAVIVMDVKTGEILACASYPSYNLATMNADWKDIEANPLKPFFNRAFGATYAPGSTFKICTLTAAMQNVNSKGERILNYEEKIRDKGVFSEYAGFAPTCLLYSSTKGATHGEIDATDALKVSCNYFFYWLGHLMTVDMLDETAKGYGLGEPTGIELYEKVGWRANEESKKASYTGMNASWTAGDRVLAAIGQSENRYTPLQLCVYTTTIANGGKRMKATFLDRVVSSDYRQLILENQPEIASTMEISWDTMDMIKRGMRKVVTDLGGTANKYFGGREDKDGVGTFPVEVCAKTGTAEHSSGGSDHGAFICFAPMNDPQIAIAIYGEKVAHGSSLAPVAEQVMEYYFDLVFASDVYTYENQVG